MGLLRHVTEVWKDFCGKMIHSSMSVYLSYLKHLMEATWKTKQYVIFRSLVQSTMVQLKLHVKPIQRGPLSLASKCCKYAILFLISFFLIHVTLNTEMSDPAVYPTQWPQLSLLELIVTLKEVTFREMFKWQWRCEPCLIKRLSFQELPHCCLWLVVTATTTWHMKEEKGIKVTATVSFSHTKTAKYIWYKHAATGFSFNLRFLEIQNRFNGISIMLGYLLMNSTWCNNFLTVVMQMSSWLWVRLIIHAVVVAALWSSSELWNRDVLR